MHEDNSELSMEKFGCIGICINVVMERKMLGPIGVRYLVVAELPN